MDGNKLAAPNKCSKNRIHHEDIIISTDSRRKSRHIFVLAYAKLTGAFPESARRLTRVVGHG